MVEKMIELLKEKPFYVPKTLLLRYHELDLNEQEVIIMIYILNMKSLTFNPKEMSNDLRIPVMDLVMIMNGLSDKNILKICVRNNGKVKEEVFELDAFYKKLAFLLVQEEKVNNTNIFSLFEKEFGRTLSPMEYEIINAWLNSQFRDETIILALKEATYNGVSNLRYIDKILHEWKKKGIETKEDIEKQRIRFKETKTVNKELMEYDWLNDESE